MRVLYVTASLPFGAGEEFIIPELAELMAQGHDVLVVPRSSRGGVIHNDARVLLPVTVAEPLVSWRILLGALRASLHAPSKACRVFKLLFKGRTPGIVFKNLAVYFKGMWLAEVASRWGAQHIHAHWASTTATMAMVASQVSGIPWSFTAHRWDIVEDNLLADKAKHAAFARFISKGGLQMALERRVPPRKARLLHMGVQIPPLPKPSGRAVPSRYFRVLCPASFLPVKGHRYLLRAFARLDPDAELWLAGEGELRRELEGLVAQLGLQQRVRFLGHVPHQSLLRLYAERQVDAVVLASVDLGNGLHEGIPVAVMEAMAYGVPVIGTCTGGIPELLADGAGLLVPPQDPAALGKAMTRLKSDPAFRQALGQAGRRRVEEQFDVRRVVEQLVQWFATIAKEDDVVVRPTCSVREPDWQPRSSGGTRGAVSRGKDGCGLVRKEVGELTHLPFVSVVIPCKRDEHSIAQSLDSILANDYRRERMGRSRSWTV